MKQSNSLPRIMRLLVRAGVLLLSLLSFPSPSALTVHSPNIVHLNSTTKDLRQERTDKGWRDWLLLPPALQAKVDPRILAELRGEVSPVYLGAGAQHGPLTQTRFLIYLQDQPDPDRVTATIFASQATRRSALVQQLQAASAAQQAPLRAMLAGGQDAGTVVGYQPFYIVNALAVEGGMPLILELVQRPDVAHLVANHPLQLVDGQAKQDALDGGSSAGTEQQLAQSPDEQTLDEENWNIALVRADRVWDELQVRGEGAVVAGFDTGVNFRHPALMTRYRGYLGNNRFEHNYNWFEPDGNLYANGDLGPSVSREPTTCGNHGTHTMGTMVGDGTLPGTQVGMAPAATWIALPGICGNTMGGGIRDNIGGIKAFQWLLCPTDLSGALATADCSMAPDVVNNSWGAANPTGETFRPLIRALRAANIAPVFAAGNPHVSNGSIGSPGNAPEAITVGATTDEDRVATFSGRGPSFYADEQKPELSAPGADVKSTIEGNEYSKLSGTSMAAPHVAGLIALMVSADLRDGVRDFSVDELEAFMAATAVDLGPAGPDNDYGYGRIDAYNAVQRVLHAGDLQGTVVDAQNGLPLDHATVTIQGSGTSVVETNAQGVYSVTVAAGTYQLQATAWGYLTATFTSQLVVANAGSVANFSLDPLPTALVQGTVRTNGTAIGGATVTVAAAPMVTTTTDAAGAYQLTLPQGTHQLVVSKAGYRRSQVTVTVAGGGAVERDLSLTTAPSILLVEADVYRGWFGGWPIGGFFRNALDDAGYFYTDWPIQYADQRDTVPLADGTVGYGIPTATTLAQYDLVIWAQSACNSGSQGCFIANSPTVLGASDEIEQYLTQGGRLILSGQDLGAWEDGAPLFTDYFQSALVADRAAPVGSTLTGNSFLSGLQLTLTNASLYGYANGVLQYAPDAVVAEGAAAAVYPVLTYDESQLPAAVAVDRCDADYRALYFAMGYENIGARGQNRDAAIAEVLERSVTWVMGNRRALDFEVVVEKAALFGEVGEAVVYPLQLINTGRQPLTLQVAVDGAQWPVTLTWADGPLPSTITLPPCERIDFIATVTIPSTVTQQTSDQAAGDQEASDQATLIVTVRDGVGNALPELGQIAQLVTTNFVNWQSAPAMPTARYQAAAVVVPGQPGQQADQLYVVGGWADDTATNSGLPMARATVERFDGCRREWQQLASLPAARAGAALATLNGDLYVVGGAIMTTGAQGVVTQPFANLWRYVVGANRWDELTPMPVALHGAAAVGVGESVYLFGGTEADGTSNNLVYRYDVPTDRWHELAPLPGLGRSYAAAVQVGDEIIVAGGYPALNLVHRYDWANDRWREGPALRQGRHSFGLVQAAGELYAVGGAVGEIGLGSVEQLGGGTDPLQGSWQPLPALQNEYRNGVVAGYLAGKILATGGLGSLGQSEELAIAPTFCGSTLTADTTVGGVGKPLRYMVQLYGDREPLSAITVRNQLPSGARFVTFLENGINAEYDAATHAITWQGSLAAHASPPALRYELVADDPLVESGDRLTNTLIVTQGNGLSFTRTAEVALLSTDLAGSYKRVDQVTALGGALLTYTIGVQGGSYVSNVVSVRDPLPAHLTFVPDSLHYDQGRGGYDEATRTIWWEGSTAATGAPFANLTAAYLWGDSRGAGSFTVPYRRQDIRATGTLIGRGDDIYFCELPIGFTFPFYDTTADTFCVSTNGFLSFDPLGDAGDTIPLCPLPDRAGNRGMIAALWDDLFVNDGIYYQLVGSAPQRALVVQWHDVNRYGAMTNQSAIFQIVLHEDGRIQILIDEVSGLRGQFSLTGVGAPSRTAGTTYACKEPASLQDQLAITFLPPGSATNVAESTVQFQARVDGNQSAASIAQLGVNVPITNTAYISAPVPTLATGTLPRYAVTLLNPLDLSGSQLVADQSELAPQESAILELQLYNRGAITATDASALITLPDPLRYVADSLSCTAGLCESQSGQITWRGSLAAEERVVVRMGIQLTRGLPDRTALTITAQIYDGFGNQEQQLLTLLARRSDLSLSQIQFQPSIGEPGTTTLLVALVQNQGKIATTGKAMIILPPQLTAVAGSLQCGAGSCVRSGTVIEWQGTLAARALVPIQIKLTVPPESAYGEAYGAELALADIGATENFVRTALFRVMHTYHLPIILGGELAQRRYLPLILMD